MKIFSKFFNKLNIGKPNKIERIYVALYIFSIVSGIIYGIVNANFFEPYEESGNLDLQQNEDNMTIFYKNFFLSGISFVTAGLSNLYFNFVTFSVVSSFLYSSGTLVALIFMMFTYGFLEMSGIAMMGLVGLGFAERIFERMLKLKISKLKIKRIFIFGVILLFAASAIEYGLAILLG